MTGLSDSQKRDQSHQNAKASGGSITDLEAKAQNSTLSGSEAIAATITMPDALDSTMGKVDRMSTIAGTSDVGTLASDLSSSATTTSISASASAMSVDAKTHLPFGGITSNGGHTTLSATVNTHKPILPKGSRISSVRPAQHPPVGARPAAQAAMQYAAAWKPRAGDAYEVSQKPEGIENSAHHAHLPQSIQVFNVERNVAGLSRLNGSWDEAEKDRARIAELDLELKAFDPFVFHTDDEYNDIIAKAREIASLRHEEVERSERHDDSEIQEQRRNSDILSRAKELAAQAMKGGLNSELLEAVKNASRSIGTQAAMQSVGAATKADGVTATTSSTVASQGNANGSQSTVGKPPSAYDDAFGGDHDGKPNTSIDNTEALNPGRDNGPFPNPQDYAPPVDEHAKDADALRAKYEKDKNESSVHHDDPKYWAQGGVNAAKSSSLPAEMYFFDGPIQPGKEGINEGESDFEAQSRLERNAFESTKFDADHDDVPETHHSQLDQLGGLSFNRVHIKKPFHSRGVYMPCFFLFDNVADQFLADEGSCRLMGITYTGEWIRGDIIRNQVTLLDSEKVFAIFFSPAEGNNVFAHVRINQGPHQGERLYITGSVVQRDETGIATLLAGYFCQIQSNFMEYLYRIVNHCASYDIDTFADKVSFGYGYQDLLGLAPDELMPKSVHEYVKLFVHPEDVVVYKKQKEVINSPANGDYYESIYRVKHSGGFYLWVIDRGLVVERKRSGKASRIIGTTTNIDVVRSNFERLKRSIYQDPLTGLHNRLYLNTRYKYFTMEESQPLTLCYVDISGLKVINDYLGHAKGDELVKISANLLREDVHLDHEVIRLSGDEFLLIFTNCTDVECKLCMNKFACNLDDRNRNFEFPLPIYFGFGVATLGEIDDGDTFMRCEARADARLQEYKTAHRERIYANLRFFIESAIGHPIDLKDNRRLEYLNDDEHNQCEETPNGARIDDLHKELPSCTSQGALLNNTSTSITSVHTDGSAYATNDDSTETQVFSAESLAKAAAEHQHQYKFDPENNAFNADNGDDDGFSLTIGVADAHEVAMQAAKDAANHQTPQAPAALRASARAAQTMIRSRPHFAFQDRKDNDNKDLPLSDNTAAPSTAATDSAVATTSRAAATTASATAAAASDCLSFKQVSPLAGLGSDFGSDDLASTPLDPIAPELAPTKQAYLRPTPESNSICRTCGMDNIVSTFASDVLEAELMSGVDENDHSPAAMALRAEHKLDMSPFTPFSEIKARAAELADANAAASNLLAKHATVKQANHSSHPSPTPTQSHQSASSAAFHAAAGQATTSAALATSNASTPTLSDAAAPVVIYVTEPSASEAAATPASDAAAPDASDAAASASDAVATDASSCAAYNELLKQLSHEAAGSSDYSQNQKTDK